jgi:hypothetical protein
MALFDPELKCLIKLKHTITAVARGGGTCSNTYFSRWKVKPFSNHIGVVKHPSKTQGKQYYVVKHFPVLS